VNKLKEIVMGIDLGKVRDYTAIAGIERWQEYKSWPYEKHELGEATYRLVYLERFPLNTDYDVQIDYTKLIYDNAIDRYSDNNLKPDLVIDATGPGLPMLDHFKKVIPSAIGVYFTSGHEVNQEKGIYYVPKKHLATNLQIIIQGKRLTFGRNLPELETLKNELMTFQYKIKESTGNESFEHWRDRDHDDCVLAIAIALWYAEKARWRMTAKQMEIAAEIRKMI